MHVWRPIALKGKKYIFLIFFFLILKSDLGERAFVPASQLPPPVSHDGRIGTGPFDPDDNVSFQSRLLSISASWMLYFTALTFQPHATLPDANGVCKDILIFSQPVKSI